MMRQAALVLAIVPTPLWADSTRVCLYDGLPQVVIRSPEAGAATLRIGGRPAAAMSLGVGATRRDVAVIDGYHFGFAPGDESMQVAQAGKVLAVLAGRCATLEPPTDDAPLRLSFDTAQPASNPAAPDAAQKPAPDPVGPAAPPGRWQVSADVSAFDDSPTVVLALEADQRVRDRFGTATQPSLVLRCKEATTVAFFDMGNIFLADIEGYGEVDYRVDNQSAKVARMAASTDNNALGYWTGGKAIPFIKALAAGDSLAVRLTPYNEAPVEMRFTLTGLDQALPKLREACAW